jgi:uncharacterized protein (TIGR01777 family)
MKNVLIAGGSGAIGNYLSSFLESKGITVSVLTRNKRLVDNKNLFYWNVDDNEIDVKCFENIDYIIQLSGANISGKRWSAEQKKEIIDSRVNSTNLLFRAIQSNNIKLKAFISSSAIGYYGAITSNHIFTETDLPGNDFLADTCVKWEEAANQFNTIDIRTVKIRIGIVLMKSHGALAKMILPAKFGFNAAFGSGIQYFPWIHIDDLCGIFHKSICDETMNGPYNAVAPTETTNKQFVRTLNHVLHKPSILPNIPAFVLKIAFGEFASTLLNGSRVSAQKISNAGFVFNFSNLQEAIRNLV